LREHISSIFRAEKKTQARNEQEAGRLLHVGLSLDLHFDLEDGDDIPPKHQLNFTGVHGVVPQKIEYFHLDTCFL
jgi:hypothetical protein